MYILETFIETLNNCHDADEAFQAYTKVITHLGFDKISYTLCNDHPSLNLRKQHGLSTTYPDDWMKYYKKNNLIEKDPVVEKLLQSRIPFFWSDLIALKDKDDPAFKMMMEASDAGLADGIGISFSSALNEVTGIGLSNSSGINQGDKNPQTLGLIYLLTIHFHEKFRSFYVAENSYKLSSREISVLSWACEGKTDDEIAYLLGITHNTVRFHWKNIHLKMTTFSKVQAVTKSLRLGLIQPGKVTYQN